MIAVVVLGFVIGFVWYFIRMLFVNAEVRHNVRCIENAWRRQREAEFYYYQQQQYEQWLAYEYRRQHGGGNTDVR